MKKNVILSIVLLAIAGGVHAGGLLTNTNHHTNFARMMARGASRQIDAVYTNPAGVAWMDEGWALSICNQSAFQKRDITATFPLFGYGSDEHTVKYKGTASAPIIPALYGVFRKDKWALSAFFGVVGGGGKCSFDKGLPQFDSQVMAALMAVPAAAGGPITPDQYYINSSMDGSQFVYGLQLGFSYKFNKHWSAYAGGRVNYFYGNYNGYVTATHKALEAIGSDKANLVNLELDCDQTGWGVTPIIGVNFRTGPVTLAAKYEFKTNLNLENKTKKNSDPEGALKDFQHGVNTPGDIPSILYIAAGFDITPKLRAAVEYHFFDDKHADMAAVNGVPKNKYLKHGTHEVLAGVEYDINKTFSVSCGAQHTDYGLSDEYQTNTAFSCDSWSVGFGGSARVSKKVTINAGYFWTMYDDYKKVVPAANPGGYNGTTLAGQDIYSRSNKVLAVGVDLKF